MSVARDPDRLIRAFLDEGKTELPDRVYHAVRSDIDRTRQRVVIGPWRTPYMNTYAKMAVAAAALLVVAVAGINLLPQFGSGIGVQPVSSPSPSLTSSPSLPPLPGQSQEATPGMRSDEAWPGQVRAEPSGGAGNVELVEPPAGLRLAFEDATGELGQGVPDWIDIATIDIQRVATMSDGRGVSLHFDLVEAPPVLDPPGQLRAYGVVIDSNNDGVPDYRIGMDNAPGRARREWISNLATGEATIHDSGSYGMARFGLFADTYFPGEADRGAEGRLLAADATPGLRFYVWASVIQNGGTAETDFAPDQGWISFRPEPWR